MSAVIQELYAELPVALTAECTALSDPKIVLDAQPKAPAFVLSCGSDLPSEHQRNYGLKTCSQNSDERLDCASKLPCPGPMELIAEEPTEAGELEEDAEVQHRILLKEDSLCRKLRESVEMSKDTRDVAKGGLMKCSLTQQQNCCSKLVRIRET